MKWCNHAVDHCEHTVDGDGNCYCDRLGNRELEAVKEESARDWRVRGAMAENLKAAVTKDMVVMPEHYGRFEIEPIRFIVENKLNWFQGNIVKYVMRYDAKNGLEDLRKAARYQDMMLKHMNGDPDWWK